MVAIGPTASSYLTVYPGGSARPTASSLNWTTGQAPTPNAVTAALNGISGFDLGGLKVSYSPANHTGLTYAELSIIGADGRFVR